MPCRHPLTAGWAFACQILYHSPCVMHLPCLHGRLHLVLLPGTIRCWQDAPLPPIPKVFRDCTMVLSEEDERRCRDLYWDVVTNR